MKRFSPDIAEASCLPFNTALKPTEKTVGVLKGSKVGSGKLSSSGGVAGSGRSLQSSFPAVGNPVHSQQEDSLERRPESVLAISKPVRVNIHPQELINTTFSF